VIQSQVLCLSDPPHRHTQIPVYSRLRSLWGPQTCQRDLDEPTDCGLRWEVAGGRESVEAVDRKLVRGDVSPQDACRCALGQVLSDEVAELLHCPGDVFATMEECREFGSVVLVTDECVGFEHSFKSLGGVSRLVSDSGKMSEVVCNLLLVPGDEDRFDVRKVFVKGGTSDTGCFGNLRHRHRCQPVLGHECGSGGQDRLMNCTAVCFDRIIPKLWHS
jgi:hypothetical protein